MAKAKVSVEELVHLALLKSATSTEPLKLTGKADGLFASASGANKEAIAACTAADAPLLTVVGMNGKTSLVALAPRGFERVAHELPDDQIGAVAKRVAAAIPTVERIEFIQAVMMRTPLTAGELVSLLEEAVAAEKVEQDARVAAAARNRELEETCRKGLERALQLLEDRRRSRIARLQRELEAEGERAEVTLLQGQNNLAPTQAAATPQTEADADFRRDVAKQLAASWRATWELNKPEVREFLESAMWNINGLRLVGEPGERVTYNGRQHESLAGVFGGDSVRLTRPGWVLDEPAGEFVVLKAVVVK